MEGWYLNGECCAAAQQPDRTAFTEDAIFGKPAHEAGFYVTAASSPALSFRFNLATWRR